MAGGLWCIFLFQESTDTVIKYIVNLEEHHRTKTFKDEYLKMLFDFEIAYDSKYLFEFYAE